MMQNTVSCVIVGMVYELFERHQTSTNAFIHLTYLILVIGHNQIIPLAVLYGVVSGEFADQRRPFATGNGLTSSTAPVI